MDEALLRLTYVIVMLVPFAFFMAAVYLALHMVFARLIGGAGQSAVLWFFSVVTRPLTRPVRALLPADVEEPRVRAVSLAVYVALWLVSRALITGITAMGG